MAKVNPPKAPAAVVDDVPAIAPDSPAINIESMIADQLLDDLDWSRVKQILIDRARQKFWVWLSSQLLPLEPHNTVLTEIDAIAIGSIEVSNG